MQNRREDKPKGNKPKNNETAETNIPVNCVSWNLCEKFAHQFITADDLGYISLWDAQNGRVIGKSHTGLSLSTACVEPSKGQQLLCGGTSDVIYLFEINREARRNERTEQISLYKDYTGHSGNVTSCGFLNTDFFVTSS